MTDPTPTRDEAVLDHERIPTWPPLKKALWAVVTGEKLNDGHYINAYQMADKLYAAALASAPAPASWVDAVAVKALEWSEPAPPNGKSRFYDYVEASTPFGLFLLEWKSWKDHDPISIEFAGEYVDVAHDLDGAKAKAEIWFGSRIRSTLASAAREP